MLLGFLSPFTLSKVTDRKRHHSHWVGLATSVNIIKIIPHREAKSPFSQVNLHLPTWQHYSIYPLNTRVACCTILWYSHLIIIGTGRNVFFFFILSAFIHLIHYGQNMVERMIHSEQCLGELWERLHVKKKRQRAFDLRCISFSGLLLDVILCLLL